MNELKQNKQKEKQDTAYCYDCDICQDTHHIIKNIDGYLCLVDCTCKAEYTLEQRKKNSNLQGLLELKTFANFIPSTTRQEKMLKMAMRYVDGFLDSNNGVFMGGQSGNGKTHLCIAILGQILPHRSILYSSWIRDIQKLKFIADDEINAKKEKVINIDVLYIDDLFKGGVSDADIRLAFEIIDTRLARNRITIFSSELLLNDIAEIDSAIGGRIAEHCWGNVIELSYDKNENYRMKGDK